MSDNNDEMVKKNKPKTSFHGSKATKESYKKTAAAANNHAKEAYGYAMGRNKNDNDYSNAPDRVKDAYRQIRAKRRNNRRAARKAGMSISGLSGPGRHYDMVDAARGIGDSFRNISNKNATDFNMAQDNPYTKPPVWNTQPSPNTMPDATSTSEDDADSPFGLSLVSDHPNYVKPSLPAFFGPKKTAHDYLNSSHERFLAQLRALND